MMINAETKLCCLIGYPVSHSLSPQIHNACYQALKLNYVYLAFAVKNLKKAILGIKELNIKGVSVTIPHKVAVIQYLDEIDKIASQIGAVNTIVNQNGVLKGYNTDYLGAIHALKEKTSLTSKTVAILGAGGAARAIVTGLMREKAKVMIFNRSLAKAEKLAKAFKIKNYFSLNLKKLIQKADIIINATPVGTLSQESLLEANLLKPNQLIFDIVYNPKETKLINQAKQRGCQVVYGYKMLLYQAVYQFKLFTGQEPPVEKMEEILLKNL